MVNSRKNLCPGVFDCSHQIIGGLGDRVRAGYLDQLIVCGLSASQKGRNHKDCQKRFEGSFV
ncbi:MAG: hypothetical protein MI919_08555, partial [Holophagales bacterium]|nr:hypothetical protein [Holophagales bacterium]